jgi:8-oxo-dGTP diphosphatase
LLEAGKWGLPAGFMDRNETAAQCCLRELKEETGWDGEILSLFRINSNPVRPHEDRQNVAIEFIVKPLQKTGEPDNESTAIEWIPFEKLLPFDQFAFDHGESLRLYLEYKKTPFSLPLLV